MAQAGLPEDVVNAVAGIQASFAAGAFDILTGDVKRLSGRPCAMCFPRRWPETTESFVAA